MAALYAWGVFAGAAVLGAIATWVSRAMALRWGFVNKPNPLIPQHTRPIAYMGGVGVFAGGLLALAGLWVVCTLAGTANHTTKNWALLVPAALYLLLGLVDDWRAFSSAHKFGWQALIAALAVALGVRYPFTDLVLVDAALAWFSILVLVNAVNFTDVCDGLVAGTAAVALLFMAHHDPVDLTFVLCWSGACLGFLVFNRPPATIFLGDAGSHLIGYLLAALALTGGRHTPAWPYLGAMTLVVAVFLFELVFITTVRIRKGLPWWRGSPDHFSLRLQAGGFTRLQTNAIAWVASTILGTAATVLTRGSLHVQVIVVVGVLALAAASWRVLLGMEVVRD